VSSAAQTASSKPLSRYTTRGLGCCSASNTASRESPITGQVRCGFLPFFLKTKCPIFSQMHLIDLKVFKNKKPATAAFLLYLLPVSFIP